VKLFFIYRYLSSKIKAKVTYKR